MGDIVTAKTALRRVIATARDALPHPQRAAAAEALARKAPEILAPASGPVRASTIIAGYSPIRSEIDPLPLMRALARSGARLALPRITPDGLVFHAYAIGDLLEKGPFGIPEPAATREKVEPGVFLTPLLAFDASGARLGYGKGHYDRVFDRFPTARRIGLAYTMQAVHEVPREDHDILLHAVMTEA
jgi:5-formyltetrahydrofolate cyclo-ligase